MKRVLALAMPVFAVLAVAALLCAVVLFRVEIAAFLGTHAWWQDVLALLSAVAVPILAYFELRHSAEANHMRREANELRIEANAASLEANRYRDEANEQRQQANLERARANEALGRIAEGIKRSPSKAERVVEKLQRYLRCKALVLNADNSRWGDAAEIVEIKDEIVTWFTPSSSISSTAFAVHVSAENLEVIEEAVGDLPLTLRVLQRFGPDSNLGETRTWEERARAVAVRAFSRGSNVFNAKYIKTGSSERRTLDVFESSDGRNDYMLVNSSGENSYGDNKEISRRFLLAQFESQTQGFRYNGGGSGGSKHELYICTRN